MDPLDYLSVRFHYHGNFEFKQKEWHYIGGRSGMSTLMYSKLSLPELKRHLSDHVSISEVALEKTYLYWKMAAGPMKTALVLLTDLTSVRSMARHVTDADVIDIYAKIPADIDSGFSSDEEVAVQQPENAPLQHDLNREEVAEQNEEQQQAREEQNAQEMGGSSLQHDHGSDYAQQGSARSCHL